MFVLERILTIKTLVIHCSHTSKLQKATTTTIHFKMLP